MKLRSWSKTLLLYANWFWSDLFPDGSEASLNDGRLRSSFCKFSQRNASGVTASTMTWWTLICRPPFWKWNGGHTSVILVRMSSGFCALSTPRQNECACSASNTFDLFDSSFWALCFWVYSAVKEKFYWTFWWSRSHAQHGLDRKTKQ